MLLFVQMIESYNFELAHLKKEEVQQLVKRARARETKMCIPLWSELGRGAMA